MKKSVLLKVIDKKIIEFKHQMLEKLTHGDDFHERYVGRIETLYLVKEIINNPSQVVKIFDWNEEK
tara:strand:+ start:255 stop:452 length:198 start_codon:yes stop_codon:yes gene_type:complete